MSLESPAAISHGVRPWQSRRRAALAALPLLCALLAPSQARGRPGGGESYSSGGGSSSSGGYGSSSSSSSFSFSDSSSSSSSSFDHGESSHPGSGREQPLSEGRRWLKECATCVVPPPPPPAPRRTDHSWLFLLPAILGCVALFAVAVKQSVDDTLRRLRDWAGAETAEEVEAARRRATAAVRTSASLAPLRARDPSLTEEDVFERTRQMATILREAWCGGDMRAARSFVSDGLYCRFTVQLALMRARGERNVMSDASVGRLTIAGIESAAPIDVVHVRVQARARDRMVPLHAGPAEIAKALRSAPLEPYVEIWSLVRRQGAQTHPGPVRVGVACPSCGAPLGDGEVAQCRYCRALVASGEHTWVLAEITQESAWHPAVRRVEGFEALRAADPGVAAEVLEDRASYLFWKWIEACATRSVVPLRKCATASFQAKVPPCAALHGVAVGGADLLACDPGAGGDLDHAYVKIFWSGATIPDVRSSPMQVVLRLVRKAGIRAEPSFSALVCAACGAPLTASDSSRCDHCRTELAAGDQAWVLDAILHPGQVRLRGAGVGEEFERIPEWLVPDVADPREGATLLARMAALMSSSGPLDRRERALLQTCAQRWKLEPATLESVLASPHLGLQQQAIGSPEQLLDGLVAAALIDGRVDARESAVLERIARELRLPPGSLEERVVALAKRLRPAG